MDIYPSPLLMDQSFVLRTGLHACDTIKNNNWTQIYASTPFEKPCHMCRNRSLARAMEDLATNVTLSMITSADLTWVSRLQIIVLADMFFTALPM
jgi:hypothetical protein